MSDTRTGGGGRVRRQPRLAAARAARTSDGETDFVTGRMGDRAWVRASAEGQCCLGSSPRATLARLARRVATAEDWGGCDERMPKRARRVKNRMMKRMMKRTRRNLRRMKGRVCWRARRWSMTNLRVCLGAAERMRRSIVAPMR